MNNIDWEKAKENVFNFLSNIDLKPYLMEFKDKKVWELMDELEEDLPYKDEYSDGLFDIIDQHEFMDYLREKYFLSTYEVSYYCVGNMKDSR